MRSSTLHRKPSIHRLKPPHLEPSTPLPTVSPAPTMVHKRQDLPAIQTTVETIVEVIVDSGTSEIVEFTLDAVPTAPTLVSLSSYGAITVPALTTFPIETAVGGFITPSSSSTFGPGGSSQIVLSSPPPTPLPTNPEMTIPLTSQPSVSTMGNSSVSSMFKSLIVHQILLTKPSIHFHRIRNYFYGGRHSQLKLLRRQLNPYWDTVQLQYDGTWDRVSGLIYT